MLNLLKKFSSIILVALCLSACGNDDKAVAPATAAPVTVAAAAPAEPAAIVTAATDTAAAPAPAAGTAITLQEGQNFKRVPTPQPVLTGDKIEVLEIFWYGCPHCFEFEPFLHAWQKNIPADIGFRRLPGVFRESWVAGAHAFYIAELLGVSEKFSAALFNAIHLQKRTFPPEHPYAQIFVEIGVNQADYQKAYNDASVVAKTKEAMVQGLSYGLEGVPSIIVDGKYLTSAKQAGGYEAMLQVTDGLIALARDERAQANKATP